MTSHEIPERHRRVARALQAGGPAAPAGLLERVEAALDRTPRRRRRRAPPALAAAAAAAAIAVAALVLSQGGGGPDVTAAAALLDRPATAPAPARDAARPALLDHRFEGVAYPDWSPFGWMAVGTRTDRVGGRSAETVFYTHHGHLIAYTVIAGEPLAPPPDATTERVPGGPQLHRFRDGERDIVMFERRGRTCVLAGHVMHAETIVELASWRGRGDVEF